MSIINIQTNEKLLNSLALGHKTTYESIYNPKLLQVVPRSLNRDTLDIKTQFYGFDLWHMYELSWLNPKGKPMVAVGELRIPAESPYIVESKSLKLYLNSFNQTKFTNLTEVANTIAKDLTQVLKCKVQVKVWHLNDTEAKEALHLHQIPTNAICLDEIDCDFSVYTLDPALLELAPSTQPNIVCEYLYSNLLKSNCLVTGQPDWGTVFIKYQGPQICHSSLLKYIVSMRGHNEFHEHCVERIFTDIANLLKPQFLEVSAFYTRRGGLNINPIRSTNLNCQADSCRLIRQ